MRSTCLFFSLIFGLFFISVSCENGTKTDVFSTKLDVVIKKNDSIHLYYNTTNSISFSEERSIWKKVKGSTKNQTITINLPKDTLPKQIRLDFGKNQNQKDIVLNKIEFYYIDKKLEFNGKEVYYVFRINDTYTALDENLGVLKRKDTTQFNGPSLYPKGDKLFHKLSQLYTKK